QDSVSVNSLTLLRLATSINESHAYLGRLANHEIGEAGTVRCDRWCAADWLRKNTVAGHPPIDVKQNDMVGQQEQPGVPWTRRSVRRLHDLVFRGILARKFQNPCLILRLPGHSERLANFETDG